MTARVFAEGGQAGTGEFLLETPAPELEMAEARLLAGVMIAGCFLRGGGIDAGLWDLRNRAYLGDSDAMKLVRELYLKSRPKGQAEGSGRR